MKKSNSIFLYIIVFIFGYLISFVFIYYLLRCVDKFVKIDSLLFFFVVIGCSFLFSITNTILFAVDLNKQKTTKISFWMRKHYPKMTIAYIIVVLLLSSITDKIIWKTEEIKDVINIEWTMLGLSISIFLVWEIVLNYLKKSQPTIDNNADFEKRYRFLQDKQSFSQKIDLYSSTILLLVINLILLLFATALVYVSHIPENLITQNLIICTFFFSTNTLLRLFLDILMPYIKEKKQLKEDNAVTKEELDAAEGKAILQTIVDTGIQTINEMDNIPEERKAELKIKYLNLLKSGFLDDNQTEKEEPKMTNNKLSQYILHYLTEDKTNSAIMLTAPWGTGKSYYIQNELVPFLSKEENGNHKCIVVSLYGMNTLFDLSRALYMESRFKKLVNPSEAATTGKFAAKTVLKGVTSFFNIDLSKTEEEMKELYESVDFSGKLIILEDLERTEISILEVLGYVNNLVEQDGVKVLLVANEDEIIKYEPIVADNAEEKARAELLDRITNHKGRIFTEATVEYLTNKEKTISDTIQFESPFSLAIKEIITDYHNTLLDQFAVGTELSDLYRFCHEIKIINLRTFVYACQKAVDIFQKIKPDTTSESDFIKTIFYGIVAFSQKIKSGERATWEEGDIFSIELATEKYPLFRFCYDYITQHIIDVSKVGQAKEALATLRLYDRKKSAGDPDLCIINSWWLCPESDVRKAVETVTERLKDEEDISFYEYGHLALCLVSIKHVVGCSIDKAKELLIRNLKGKGLEINADNIFTFLINNKDDPAVVKEIQQLKKDMKNSLNSIGEAIYGFDYKPSTISNFRDTVEKKGGEISDNGSFATRLDNEKIVSMLKQCSAAQIQDFRLVYYRIYESGNISEFLPNDKDALLDLYAKVKELKGFDGFDKIQKHQIGFFIKNLKEALTRYGVNNPEASIDSEA